MRLWGHPVHPILVHFPVAFWTVGTVAYIADAAGVEGAAAVAKLSNAAGLIMALLAMTAGLMELRLIDSSSAAMRVATTHMMAMAAAWVCFMAALVITISAGASLDKQIAQLVGVGGASVGFLLMSAGGWLGGRLVYEFGIGVATRKE
jgi:uncharacterized membrane protein